jgi:hypothetical protein
LAGKVRIEGGLGLEHGAGDANEAVGDGSERAAMTVAAGAKGRVFRLASRIVLHSDAGPMVDGVAQANVGGLAHEHDAALAGSLGDGSHPRQTSKRSIVPPLHGAVSEFSCVGRAVDPVQAIARMKRSPKRMANCALAMHHSRAGMVHSFSDRFKTRNSSFRAASSVGK